MDQWRARSRGLERRTTPGQDGQRPAAPWNTGSAVTVRPVVDPTGTAPVGYEIPGRLREALFLRNPVDVFPYGQATSRTLDLDHTVPYVALDHGGPPGQTGQHNLGPLARSHHRAVTSAGSQRRQPEPRTYLFRSPDGYAYLTTDQATLALGRTAFVSALWTSAAEPSTWTPTPAATQAAAARGARRPLRPGAPPGP